MNEPCKADMPELDERVIPSMYGINIHYLPSGWHSLDWKNPVAVLPTNKQYDVESFSMEFTGGAFIRKFNLKKKI